MLKGIICQQQVTGVDGRQIAVFEVLRSTPAIQNMIREGKLHQLESTMQQSSAEGMFTIDMSLLKLYKEGKIDRNTALVSCNNFEFVSKRLEN